MNTADKQTAKYGQKDLSDSPYYGIPASEAVHIPRINFQLLSGKQMSLPYPYLGEISWNGGQLTLVESRKTIVIEGRHLGKLYQYLNKHRVSWVKEADSDFEEIEDKPFVSSITINLSS